jgi:hypothetical protein
MVVVSGVAFPPAATRAVTPHAPSLRYGATRRGVPTSCSDVGEYRKNQNGLEISGR